MAQLKLNQVLTAQPGEEFEFLSESGRLLQTQYHFEVTGPGAANVVIGIWGADGKGKARNKQHETYVDRTLPAGTWRITVANMEGDYQITVRKNSQGKKIFGGFRR